MGRVQLMGVSQGGMECRVMVDGEKRARELPSMALRPFISVESEYGGQLYSRYVIKN